MGLAEEVDQFFLIVMGMIVVFLQAGFAFLEAGSVRSKNVTNILIKNVFDQFVSGFAYWLFGYAFAYGEGNTFIGWTHFAIHDVTPTEYAGFFFQYTFAATAATIVSGAVAERCELIAYFIYSFFITGVIYPIVSRWQWYSDGFLAKGMDYGGEVGVVGYTDFAGSGVLHVLGGVAALCGAWMLGPRIGRFDKVTRKTLPMRGHSVPLTSLGGFILFFGFLAFNGGSLTHISQPGDGAIVARSIVNTIIAGSFAIFLTSLGGFILFFGFLAFNGGSLTHISQPGDGAIVARSIVNTIIAGSFAAFVALTVNRIKVFGTAKWSLLVTINGALTGMVSTCSGVNAMEPWGACAVGCVAGVVYHASSNALKKLNIDDPLDAVTVHLSGGLLGVIAVAFLHREEGIFFNWNRRSGLILAWQFAGVSLIIAWTTVLSLLLFGILKLLKILRVPEDMEIKGLDIPKHNEPAYPIESYGHGHVEDLIEALESNPSHVPQFFERLSMHLERGHPIDAVEADINGKHPPIYPVRAALPPPDKRVPNSYSRAGVPNSYSRAGVPYRTQEIRVPAQYPGQLPGQRVPQSNGQRVYVTSQYRPNNMVYLPQQGPMYY